MPLTACLVLQGAAEQACCMQSIQRAAGNAGMTAHLRLGSNVCQVLVPGEALLKGGLCGNVGDEAN